MSLAGNHKLQWGPQHSNMDLNPQGQPLLKRKLIL